ncbi:ABC transporter permease [Arsenicitalea aurantiaca]|uniref:ABC transporter permease n=1 Tax=Arsenicitalea aurantiaca TaxID=1783274 RepID=UPI001FCE6E72|nr:ABC transporter permease [Arsenicitalea aurantiaca]
MRLSADHPGGFVLLRLLRLVLVLLAVAIIAFALLKASPIDPVDAYLGADIARVGPDQRAAIAERWGLDQPAPVQFTRWLSQLLSGDPGFSRLYNAPVAEVIAERAGASFLLMALAWALSGVVGFGLGILAGARENSLVDRIIRTYAYGLAGTPTFWIAMVMLMVFSVGLGVTPVCCAGPIGVPPADVTLLERLHHLVLPLIALTLLGVAQITLHTRAKMVEIMSSEIALYARAQGASRADIALRHGARNAALPAITMLFASLGELFGGAVLAEQVFAYPGLGQATIAAGLGGDVPLLLAITLVAAALVSVGNAIADLLYRLVDPRMRRGPHEVLQ